MRRLKKGDVVQIVGSVCVRRVNGKIENMKGQKATVTSVKSKNCYLDIGLSKPVNIPKSFLELVA